MTAPTTPEERQAAVQAHLEEHFNDIRQTPPAQVLAVAFQRDALKDPEAEDETETPVVVLSLIVQPIEGTTDLFHLPLIFDPITVVEIAKGILATLDTDTDNQENQDQ